MPPRPQPLILSNIWPTVIIWYIINGRASIPFSRKQYHQVIIGNFYEVAEQEVIRPFLGFEQINIGPLGRLAFPRRIKTPTFDEFYPVALWRSNLDTTADRQERKEEKQKKYYGMFLFSALQSFRVLLFLFVLRLTILSSSSVFFPILLTFWLTITR